MKKSLCSIYITALYQPHKLIHYRFLPFWKMMQFLFLLAAILTLPAFLNFLASNAQQLTTVKWLLYPATIFSLLIVNFILIVGLTTLCTWVTQLFLQFFNCSVPFSQIWRIVILCATIGVSASSLMMLAYHSNWLYFCYMISMVYYCLCINKFIVAKNHRLN